MMVDPRSSEAVQAAQSVVNTAVGVIVSDPKAIKNFISISSVDYHTYTHSVHVMTFAVSLGRRLGYSMGPEPYELGYSGLFHDVGKSFIEPKLLDKDGPLTSEEFEELKQHPNLGYQALRQSGEVSESVLDPVLHHHEKLNGKGYPGGLEDKLISTNARIISIVDIFDALTTQRTYREASDAFPALQMMKDLVGPALDAKIFNKFVRMRGEME
jgi:HD-GYP domain-containing protein (c-di-GMP phosphodiesterase class II)